MQNEIIVFEDQSINLEVNLKRETVWLTQAQIAELFDKDRKKSLGILKIYTKMGNSI